MSRSTSSKSPPGLPICTAFIFVLAGARHYPKARKELVKLKNASGINPRLKIEDLSATLDLDPERIINRFLRRLILRQSLKGRHDES
jgi:hypothetical protein